MNVFVEGIDPTSTFGGYASVLLQLIRQATPAAGYGTVIHGTSTPDTVTYPWTQRCLWVNTTTGITYRYDTGTASWVNAFTPAAGSITNSMLAGSIAISKFATTSLSARQLLRANAANTAIEGVNPASAFASNELPLNSLANGGASGNVLTWNGTAWTSAAPSGSGVADGSLAPVKLSNPGAGSSTWFVTADTTGVRSWKAFGNSDIPNNTIDPVKLLTDVSNNGKLVTTIAGVSTWAAPSIAFGVETINITSLNHSPVMTGADRLLGWNGVAWADYPVYHIANASSGTLNSWSANSYYDFTTSLTAPVELTEVYLVCGTADAGYQPGDRLNLSSLRVVGDKQKAAVWYSTFMSGGGLKVRMETDLLATWTNAVIKDSTGAAWTPITKSSWYFEAVFYTLV